MAFASYAGWGGSCLGGGRAGALRLMAWIAGPTYLGSAGNWPNATNVGVYNCRPPSLHGEGRAGDIGFPGRGHPDGYRLAEALVAAAEALGIQRVIWAGREWDARPGQRQWEPYTGASDHFDHVHWELSWDTANTLTAETIAAALGGQEEDMPLNQDDKEWISVAITNALKPIDVNVKAANTRVDQVQADVDAILEAVQDLAVGAPVAGTVHVEGDLTVS